MGSWDAYPGYCPAVCSAWIEGTFQPVIVLWGRSGDTAGFYWGSVNTRCIPVPKSDSAAFLMKSIVVS
jgi:hypothetical protein